MFGLKDTNSCLSGNLCVNDKICGLQLPYASMMGKLICSFLAGMETNFIKERKTCCTKSVIAVATGTLYMLEKREGNAITVL